MGSVGSNAIYKDGAWWYFWGLNGHHRLHGPYDSEEKCKLKLEKYAHWLSTGEYDGNWND